MGTSTYPGNGPGVHAGDGRTHQFLWRNDAGAAEIHVFPEVLVISVTGRCGYDHLVELSFHVGRRWDPTRRDLVVDFSRARSVDEIGVRFLLANLQQAGHRGRIFVVRAPHSARSLANRIWGGEAISFVFTLRQALTSIRQANSTEVLKGPGGARADRTSPRPMAAM